MIPTHWLHVYQKPKVGTGFIKRFPAQNYKHRILNNGGNDTMSCDVHVSRAEAEQIFTSYIGNRVAVYVDNPAMHIWEGLITRITIRNAGIESMISIDDMANRATTIWRNGDGGGSTPASNISTTTNNTSSQAVYGIKEIILSAGYEHASAPDRPTKLQATYLALHSWPIISTKTSSSAGTAILSIEARGFFHTLDWEKLYTVDTTNLNPHTILSNMLGAMANGNAFFDNTDTSQIVSNTGFSTRQNQGNGITLMQLAQMLAEPGNGVSARWIYGIENTGTTRRLYYRAASSSVTYTARTADNLRIRNPFGGLVRPWSVKPDGVFRVLDVGIGFLGTTYINAPNEFYIGSVNYDANTQQVDLQGDDNITVEGIYQFGNYAKPFNKRFGWKVTDAVVY